MPEIGSQSQSLFAARIVGLWVCPKVRQIEVTAGTVYRELHSVCLPASLPHTSVSVPEIN
jgi:hypothetical protein